MTKSIKNFKDQVWLISDNWIQDYNTKTFTVYFPTSKLIIDNNNYGTWHYWGYQKWIDKYNGVTIKSGWTINIVLT